MVMIPRSQSDAAQARALALAYATPVLNDPARRGTVPPEPQPTGHAGIDRMMAASRSMVRDSARLAWRLGEELDRLGSADLLIPATMTSARRSWPNWKSCSAASTTSTIACSLSPASARAGSLSPPTASRRPIAPALP
ncbi:hypothetical protein INH39_31355 [Massilia violaceinigra]|uniref:Uncharacterized protein n=1 Tax=Massilia violaceinigra TaxID=2045208 RepID=A0ABY4A578_9BURK|nr:hypothetical protein [Massilia violaceinigra]UOD29817.1 hypothetical protein INH39_31355 [Massilia violaceinigra]